MDRETDASKAHTWTKYEENRKNVTATWNENATSRKWNRCNCSRVLRSVHCEAHLANVTSFCYFLWFYGYLEHPDSLGIYSSVIQTEALTGCGALSQTNPFIYRTHLSWLTDFNIHSYSLIFYRCQMGCYEGYIKSKVMSPNRFSPEVKRNIIGKRWKEQKSH